MRGKYPKAITLLSGSHMYTIHRKTRLDLAESKGHYYPSEATANPPDSVPLFITPRSKVGAPEDKQLQVANNNGIYYLIIAVIKNY